jgi:hypothetical protein
MWRQAWMRKAAGRMDDLAVDEYYEDFTRFLNEFPPSEVIRRLRRWGANEKVIAEVQDRHEREMLKIKKMREPHTIVTDGRDTWYTGPQQSDKGWPGIVKILENDNWSDAAIEKLDAASTRVVSLLNHPQEPPFRTCGLVVGHVQSGKTTNFTSVIAKATDRGYKFVIVLSGIHNGLRRQTQTRLEEQLVDSNKTGWTKLTERDKDFQPNGNVKSLFGAQNRTHVLSVDKKNGAVLEKFARWLEGAGDLLESVPTLIIDDEADQATVATKRINPLIQRIMRALPKSVYLAYTASPFANLLIDPANSEDLYPKDFVVNLPKPEGHFGTEELFGRDVLEGEDPQDVFDGYDMIRTVPDDDIPMVRPLTRAGIETFEPTVTATLERAVRYFWLVTAARMVRRTGKKHNTMLVHTTTSSIVQNQFQQPLEDLVFNARQNVGNPDFMDELRELWQDEGARVPAGDFGHEPVPFDQLATNLPEVLERCQVIIDNYTSKQRLDYEGDPVVAIAVGGNTLSRGLTLEGLSVSYFVRSATAYDTLLQMGRWFGFRHGYEDLPRIWMTNELASWFRHLATVEEEMRRDIDVYMAEAKTPLEFAVRLRTHPALQVTAAAKMKDAVSAPASYGNQRVQTHYFDLDRQVLRGNIQAARDLVAWAEKTTPRPHEPKAGRFVYEGVSHTAILNFFKQYSFHPEAAEARQELLIAYLKKRAQQGALHNWNVVLLGNRRGRDTSRNFSYSPSVSLGLVTRAKLDVEGRTEAFADIKTLMSRADAVADIPTAKPGLSEKEIRELRNTELPDTGLLVLYAIDKDSQPKEQVRKSATARKPLGAAEHVIGVGLMFPSPRGAEDAAWADYSYVSADLSKVSFETEDQAEELAALEALEEQE